VSTDKDLSIGLAEQAQLIQWHVGVWHDLGYCEPLPSPDCHPIPPLGERPASAIKGGHDAIRDIDELIRQLHALREQLVSELRQDEDIRAARVDAMLAVAKEPDCRADTRVWPDDWSAARAPEGGDKAGAQPVPALPRLRPMGACCDRAVYDDSTGWWCPKHGDPS
jgi:hypothetical protein